MSSCPDTDIDPIILLKDMICNFTIQFLLRGRGVSFNRFVTNNKFLITISLLNHTVTSRE